MATTALQIIDDCDDDLRLLLNVAAGEAVLLKYVNRINRMILQHRQWDWLLSALQRFITERGQIKYWIGATGSVSAGQVNTALNLTDVLRVKMGHVIARSRRNILYRVDEPPFGYQNEDGSYREGPPQWYRNDPDSSGLIEIFPAPDEGSTYELVPPAPHSTTASGASLAARTYFLRTTFVDLASNQGEPSTTARQFVEASKKLTVKAPQPVVTTGASGISYLRYNVYASTTEGSETLQNATPTATSSDWTEPDTGLTTTGATVPTSFDLDPLRGYPIEFRYEKAITDITTTSTNIQVPDRFKDAVIAGVNWLGYQLLKRAQDSTYWRSVYEERMLAMVKEQTWYGGARFIRPDTVAIVSRQPGGWPQGGLEWWKPESW